MNKRKQRKFAMLASGVAVLLGVQSAWVAAQEEDEQSPFSFSVSQSFTWEDNMYRLPDGQPPRDGSDRSDVVSDTNVGINFDKAYSRQSFHAGISATHSIYRTHSNLDNTAPDANLRWDWRAGDRWSGVLGYGWSESFVGFEDTYTNDTFRQQEEKLMRQLSRANASADFWWHPNWATGFGFSDVRSDYRDDARPYDQYEAQQASLNLTYRPSTGNRIVFSLRGEEGQYPNQPKQPRSMRDWERYDAQVSAQWQLTGATKLSGYTGYTQRKYDLAPERDFSGVTGKIAFNWMPSGKAIVDLSWRREIGADADIVSNYAVTQGWSLQPTWVISSKVRLGATFEYLNRDYGGDPGSLPSYLVMNGNPKEAKIMSYGLNLQYMPTPNANIVLRYRQQKREADREIYDSIYGFDARTVWLSGSLSF